MPVGFLITAGLMALAMAASLFRPFRSGLLGPATWTPPLLIVHGDRDTLTPATRARVLAEQARSALAEPVVYVELPGAEHSFDLLSSIRFEAVIDGIEAFAASIAAPDRSRADHAYA